MQGPALEHAMRTVSELQEIAKSAAKSAVDEASGEIEDILRKEYSSAASGWYSAYTPKKYKKRKYSIMNLMSIDYGSENDLGWIMSDDNMTKSSTGESMFDPIFVGGSHGLRHRSFIPTVTTPVPELFEDGMNSRADDISSILYPHIESYFYRKLAGFKY